MTVRKQRADSLDTKRRLLEAAAEVFATKGYWAATNADICEKAGANTAAVNYHFGSKDNLYVEAWKFAYVMTLLSYPPDGGAPPEAPAEERLRGRVSALVRRFNHPGNYEYDIIQKEMANPTGLLTDAVHEFLRPVNKDLTELLKELLGAKAGPKEIHLCHVSIMSQCLDPLVRSHFARKGIKPPEGGLPFDLNEYADHVTRFSLCGIRGAREALEDDSLDSHARSGGS